VAIGTLQQNNKIRLSSEICGWFEAFLTTA